MSATSHRATLALAALILGGAGAGLAVAAAEARDRGLGLGSGPVRGNHGLPGDLAPSPPGSGIADTSRGTLRSAPPASGSTGVGSPATPGGFTSSTGAVISGAGGGSIGGNR